MSEVPLNVGHEPPHMYSLPTTPQICAEETRMQVPNANRHARHVQGYLADKKPSANRHAPHVQGYLAHKKLPPPLGP